MYNKLFKINRNANRRKNLPRLTRVSILTIGLSRKGTANFINKVIIYLHYK